MRKKTSTHHILIAEDEKPIAKALSLKLQAEGYQATVVGDGKAALEAVKKSSPDLLILDLMMPEIDGFGVLQALQKTKKKLPVIVTSNLSQQEDVDRAKSLGAKEYFVKSNTPLSELITYVKKLLS